MLTNNIRERIVISFEVREIELILIERLSIKGIDVVLIELAVNRTTWDVARTKRFVMVNFSVCVL